MQTHYSLPNVTTNHAIVYQELGDHEIRHWGCHNFRHCMDLILTCARGLELPRSPNYYKASEQCVGLQLPDTYTIFSGF